MQSLNHRFLPSIRFNRNQSTTISLSLSFDDLVLPLLIEITKNKIPKWTMFDERQLKQRQIRRQDNIQVRFQKHFIFCTLTHSNRLQPTTQRIWLVPELQSGESEQQWSNDLHHHPSPQSQKPNHRSSEKSRQRESKELLNPLLQSLPLGLSLTPQSLH